MAEVRQAEFPAHTPSGSGRRLLAAVTQGVGLALLAALGPGPAAAQAGAERPPTLAASEILPPELRGGEHFHVAEEVENDGYMNRYRILSEHGVIPAYGTPMLVIRLQEADALSALDELSKTRVFADAAAEAALSPVESLVELAERPVVTVKGIPQGVGRMFRRYKRDVEEGIETAKEVGGEIRDAVGGSDDEGQAEEAGSGDSGEGDLLSEAEEAATDYARKYFGISAAQRRWAEKLGTDPYTSNEALQRAIQKVARVDAAGRFGLRILGPPSIPGARYASGLNELVWSTDPRELRELNDRRLAELGASRELIEAFFANPALSPTHQTHIVGAVLELDGAAGRALLLEQAGAVGSEPEALFFVATLRMLADFHRLQSPIVQLLGGTRLPGAVTRDNRFVYLFPVDYLFWTEEIAAAARGPLLEVAQGQEVEVRELWLQGRVSSRAREQLEALGWRVRSEVVLAVAGEGAGR